MDETGNDTKPAPTARLAPKSKPASKTPTVTKEYDFDRFKAPGKKVPKRTAPKQTRGNVSAIIAKYPPPKSIFSVASQYPFIVFP
jgi:hypothetical protein